jgi:hypothetical protein
MQKKVSIVLLGLLFAGLVVPLALVNAEATAPPLPEACVIRADPARVGVTGCPGVSTTASCVYETNRDCGICCLIGTVLYITDWVFVIFVIIVVVMVLMGAFNIMTAAGAPDKVAVGRNYIMYAALGFGLALLAKAVPAIVKYLIIGSTAL